MIKPTKTNLSKVELILTELGYDIIYEKGNFKSGYCIVENKKVVVISKFFQTEARINTILDIISTLDVDTSSFTTKTMKAYLLISNQFSEEQNN